MQEIMNRGATMCVSKAAFAAGTTTTYSTTGTTLYCIEGKAYSKAAQTNTATPTLDINTGVAFLPVAKNTGSVYVAGFDAGGTLRVAQGTITPLNAAGTFIEVPEWPALPADFCPIAYMHVKAADTTTVPWIFGAHNQNTGTVTGVTYTRQDVMTLPRRPQSA